MGVAVCPWSCVQAFDAIERIVASPEFLKSIEAGNKEAASTSSSTAAGGTAKKQGAIKRTFLRWGTGKEVELQHKPLVSILGV